MLKKFVFIVFGTIFIHFGAIAETTISLDAGKDEQNNSNSMLSVDMELHKSKRLFFGIGNSKTPSGNEAIENRVSFIGMSIKMND